jgi:hypothetical protein
MDDHDGEGHNYFADATKLYAAEIRVYPTEIDEEDGEPNVVLGEAERAALGLASVELIDSCFRLARGDPPESPDPDLSEYLPPRYALRYDAEFYQRMCVTLVQVTEKLAGITPVGPHLPATLAEELALHAVLEHARDQWQELLDLGLLKNADPIFHRPTDFGEFIEEAFWDTDYLYLYDDAADGIDESFVGRYQRMAPQDFASWFTHPYGDYRLHPYLRSAE